MPLSVFVLLVLAQVQQVEGLREGERVVEVAPGVSVNEDLRYGRVLDAFTGRPLAGARVELWSEEISGAFGGFFRIDAATSGEDGCFAVAPHSGGRPAEKLRVSAPGYLTFSGTVGDVRVDILLFPVQDEPLRVRVTDAGGRPVVGARLTTTYSCAHDVTALDVRTDAVGEAVCPTLGLQRDVQELRVRAPGFAAIKYLPPDAALSAPGRPHLAATLLRQRGAVLRVLDRDGEAASDRAVHVVDGDGFHVARTNARGEFALPCRYDHGALLVYLMRAGDDEFVGEVRPVGSQPCTLRVGGEDWPEETPTGRVRVVGPEEGPKLRLHHADGWCAEIAPGEAAEFPAGEVLVAYGGEFSGFAGRSESLDVVRGSATEVRLDLVAEPRVRVVASDGHAGEVLIQAGDVTHGPIRPPRALAVPAGEPLVVKQAGEPDRLLCVERVVDGMEIDLADAAPCDAPPPVSDETAACELVFVDGAGRPVGGDAGVRGSDALCRIEAGESAGRFRVSGPVGAPFLVSFAAAGRQEIWVRGRVESGAAVRRVVVPALASLRVEAPFEFRVVGLDRGRLEALAPGPLRLVVERADGKRLGLDLVLGPGERRVLTLRP